MENIAKQESRGVLAGVRISNAELGIKRLERGKEGAMWLTG